jgi:predicted transposase YbfD/YdcC
MKAIVQILDMLQEIPPSRVETYLRSHNWHQQEKIADKASIWTQTNALGQEFEILLPLKPDILDFPRRMSEVLETLALAENRSQIDILSELITQAKNITIQGIVIQIDTPIAEQLSGKITLLGVIVDKLRKIQAELTDHDYILAIKAYQERLPIVFTGDLFQENNYFMLKNIEKFTLIEAE